MKHINKNLIVSFIISAVMLLLTVTIYNITYWLNDDVMIENILSGAFTGSPEFMTYYFSVPLSLIISCLYGIIPVIPWFGIFYVAVYFLCFFLITNRILNCAYNKEKPAILSLYMASLSACLFLFIFLSNVALLHYTILSAITGASGVFLIISKDQESIRLKSFAMPFILLLLSYLIRENVFFMLMPFFAVALLYSFIKCGKSSLATHIKSLAIFALLFVVLFLVNRLPFQTATWKSYVKYNDERTTLYDYVGVDTKENARKYYADNGITDDEYDLYRSYNLMLAKRNDQLLNTFSSYDNIRYADRTAFQHFKEAFYVYRESLFKSKDYKPLNPVILALYLISIILLVKQKEYKNIISIACLFLVRTGMWMFLIWNDRYPIRVTHSLLYMELFVLLGIIIDMFKEAKTLRLQDLTITLTLLSLLAGAYFTFPALSDNYKQVTESNENDNALYNYINNNQDYFFVIDVFTSVNRTKPAINLTKPNTNNYIVAGGWMCESPLTYKKLSLYNASSLPELILTNPNVRIVLKEEMYNDININNYSTWLGTKFELDETINGTTDTFLVYKKVAD